MSSRLFTWRSAVPHPIADVFSWHTRPGAFERLNPAWRPVKVIRAPQSLQPGSEVTISLPVLGPIRIPWHLRHGNFRENEEFNDEQISGPFVSWRHRHRFISETPTSTTLLDEITFQPPWYAYPAVRLIERELTRLFAFRHKRLADDLSLHARWSDKPHQKILIAGASGFIGQALCAFLSTAGHTIVKLVRRAPRGTSEYQWDPNRGILNPDAFADVDVVINLAGEPILGRWTQAKKRAIKESRVNSTALLTRTITGLAKPPRVAIIASAIGFYGDTHGAHVDESSPGGRDFLADVCRSWEEASQPVEATACRLVHLRIGTVLSPLGGALKQLLPIFSLGLGGTIGRGGRCMSWIALEDLLGIIEHAIFSESLVGPVNAVTPTPITNREFTHALARLLRRPALCPVPPLILRALYGEVADSILLASAAVTPNKLTDSGYTFLYPDITSALRAECGIS